VLQVKKIKNLKAAFKMFNSIQRRPGKGDITYMELQVSNAFIWCILNHTLGIQLTLHLVAPSVCWLQQHLLVTCVGMSNAATEFEHDIQALWCLFFLRAAAVPACACLLLTT